MILPIALISALLAGASPDAGRKLPSPAPMGTDDAGPAIVMLDKVPGCYGPVRFDHQLHAGMSPIRGGCKNCHHDLTDEMKGSNRKPMQPCRTCHEPTSALTTNDKPGLRGAYHRQYLSCHKDWMHENACGSCHTSTAAARALAKPAKAVRAAGLERSLARSAYVYNTGNKAVPIVTFHHADHAEKFGLKCADCHAGASCGGCHGPRTARPVVNRQQNCYTCHSESRCVTCHDLRERGSFDHGARTRWWLRPAHAALACSGCHVAGEMPASPSSDACRTCHAKRWGDQAFDHGRTGVVLSGDHALFECIQCHRGGDKQMVASCTSCHEERPIAGKIRVGRELAVGLTD